MTESQQNSKNSESIYQKKLKFLSYLESIEKDLAEKKLDTFFRCAWKVLEPATNLLYNWHHDAICEHLEAVTAGEIRRLIINMPPRYGKSNLVTVCFPTWVWITNPEKRFMFTSYSSSLSTKHSKDRRDLIESEWYQSMWKDRYVMATDQNVKTEYQNDKRGHMISTSMTGTATGKGCNILIADDPHDTTKAASDIKRDSDVREFRQKFVTRLDDKKKDSIIVVMQRLHENDLSGHLLSGESEYTHLKLPAEYKKKTMIVLPRSKKEISLDPGSVLHPEREGKKDLAQAKRDLGSRVYAGQYMQEPSPAEGNIIKRSWIKYYKVLPSDIWQKVSSWDLSFKDSKTSDFVAGHVWGRNSSDFYFIDRVHGKMDMPATVAAFRAFTAKHPDVIRKLVEDKANGPAIIATLKSEITGIIPVNPKSSKEARTHAIAPLYEAGNVWFPDPSIAPWIHDVIEEIVKFPSAKNDDDVDAMTQALNDFVSNKQPQIISLVDDDDDDWDEDDDY